MYHRERAYNSFNPALRCDSPLSSQMSEKSTTPGREGGKGVERRTKQSGEEDQGRVSQRKWKYRKRYGDVQQTERDSYCTRVKDTSARRGDYLYQGRPRPPLNRLIWLTAYGGFFRYS